MLNAYKEFLLKKGTIKPQHISFYMKWVSNCYAFLDELPSTRLSSEQKKQFLSDMAKRHEDWQVKQADTALRLYDYFLFRDKVATAEKSSAYGTEWRHLEEKMHEALRLRQRSFSTEKTYLTWVRSFRSFVQEKQPLSLEGRDLQDFLSHLAVEKKIAPSTQNQALNAVVFFYRHVLAKNIENELSAVRARQRRHLPVVLTAREVQSIFEHLSGTSKLMAKLIYGCGLRLQECLSLHIKDIDLEQHVIIVRSGKGDKDRETVLPETLKDDLIRHISEIRSLYDRDRKENLSGVWLPALLSENIRTRARNGRGSGFFPQKHSL